jgi:misacylated tRNA(Ala) deacylase
MPPPPPTEELFREDAYLASCDARVVAVREGGGGVVLDRTVFYPGGGGQPADAGALRLPDGAAVPVTGIRPDPERPGEIVHLVAAGAGPLRAGDAVAAELDWPRRHRLMRMHSLLHLLCRAVDAPVTGGQVDDGKGRLDFDVPDAGALDKDALTARLAAWVADDRPVTARWVDEEELDARPELVRTMSVRPPRGRGRVRLVAIEGVDLQACGGTHVRSTGEIGRAEVARIEKKGRLNRRVVVTLLD